MSKYEWALLLLTAIVMIILVWDTQRMRYKLKDLEASQDWLAKALRHQAEVHQKILDQHTVEISRVWRLARAIDRQIPAVQRLVAQAERNVKGDFWKKGEVYVDGEMAAGIGSEAERTRTPGDPDGAGS